MRQAREFFERYLVGVMTLAEANIRPIEMAEKIKGRRRLPREELVVDFGGYVLVIDSPAEKPPIGRIRLINVVKSIEEEGPLDVVTWERLGQIVKKNPPDPALTLRPKIEKEDENGVHGHKPA